jgi:hypothetical protein
VRSGGGGVAGWAVMEAGWAGAGTGASEVGEGGDKALTEGEVKKEMVEGPRWSWRGWGRPGGRSLVGGVGSTSAGDGAGEATSRTMADNGCLQGGTGGGRGADLAGTGAGAGWRGRRCS